MTTPPQLLGQVPVREFTAIDGRHIILDSATLDVAGTRCGPARYLALCRADDEKGYYLFFCNKNWHIWNDLWFEDVQDAKDYVESDEYSGTISTWEKMT